MNGPAAADLIAAFRARRCYVCGAPAAVVCPGAEAEYSESVSCSSVVKEAVPDINICLDHAAPFWPWKPKRRRRRLADA